MNQATSRALLYGSAVAVLGGIGFFAATVQTEADVMTLLSSADVQLRTAYMIPETGREGEALESRGELIATAIDYLERVERVQPGMAVTAEFRGFAHMLNSEFGAAAACYRRARDCDDVGDEQRDVLLFNEARMLAKSGRQDEAIEVFERNAAALDGRFGHQRRIEQAAMMRELGRVEDAIASLDVVRSDDAAPSMAWLQAGQEYGRLGLFESAEWCLEAARDELPIADYHLAQLKLQQGEVDTGLELLARAYEARPTEVRRKLREDADAWSTVADDARYIELSESQPASPGR